MSTCTCNPPSRARRNVSVPSSSRARAAMLTSPRCSPDGQATLAEAKALADDGVPVAPLPLPVTPPERLN